MIEAVARVKHDPIVLRKLHPVSHCFRNTFPGISKKRKRSTAKTTQQDFTAKHKTQVYVHFNESTAIVTNF